MAASTYIKIKLREVNRHLVCRLCRGYYVDATTIAECLHSFCRSCIIKYLEKNSFCPICEVQIHKTKPYLNLRLDKALQDVVYKVVPGLYHNEMKRRRDFYSKRKEQSAFATPEQCGLEERIIFSPEDSISLSLEYLESDDYESEVSSRSSESGDNTEILSFPQQLGLLKIKSETVTSRRESQDVQENSVFPKRYLQCPAVVNIGHLKKFIKMKHDLSEKTQVSIIHKRVRLPEYYTLMDVAYIFTWKRSSPLKLFYQIYQTKKRKLKLPPSVLESAALKRQPSTDEIKAIKTELTEKLCKSVVEKPSPELLKSAKASEEINETVTVDSKTKKLNNVLKNVDDNTPKTEVKIEASENSSANRKTKVEIKPDANSQANKNEKSKSNRVNSVETKVKSECSKRKTPILENVQSKTIDTKENDSKNQERLLLNPISGQLESVCSQESHKPSVVEKIPTDNSKELEEKSKKEISTKTASQSTKDSKNSSVNLLKNFRKEKSVAEKDAKPEIKNCVKSSLTITAIPKKEKPTKEETSKSAEIKTEAKVDNKSSEYDFDGSSPPSKIIPLQEFSKYSKYSKFMAEHRDKWLSKEKKNNLMSPNAVREKILKGNEAKEEDVFKRNKKKDVPPLYKINSEKNKTSSKKNSSEKVDSEKSKGNKLSFSEITKKSENGDTKVKKEVDSSKKNSLQIKIGNKDGEYSIRPVGDKKTSSKDEKHSLEQENKTSDITKHSSLIVESVKAKDKEAKTALVDEKQNDSLAMDLSKTESPKNSHDDVEDSGNKSNPVKKDEKTLEALISAAQKQNIEPLLKIPQYSQMLNSPGLQGSGSPTKNISPSEISQALQFLEDLKSDMKFLESKSPNSVLEQFAQKSGNFEPYQQLYQQKIDLIRRLKRHHQILPNESDGSYKKRLKLSPPSESKKKLSPSSEPKPKTSPVADDGSQYKSSMERTLTQIQMMELQSRMLVAQNYKNLPALLQYYNRPPNFCSGLISPPKSNPLKLKPSSLSPNKSPQSLSSSSGNSPLPPPVASDSFFNSQSYNHLINTGLNSEMTYHQMFQSYLNQQEQMNQVKLSQLPKKPVKFSEVSPKSLSEKYYGSSASVKRPELNNSVSPVSKS